MVLGPLKVLFQIWGLLLVLGYRTKPAKWIIVQVGQAVHKKDGDVGGCSPYWT